MKQKRRALGDHLEFLPFLMIDTIYLKIWSSEKFYMTKNLKFATLRFTLQR